MKRRRDYRRLRQQSKAVSPVVATLILILVAVAAAAALYLWLTGWQTSITKTIGTPTPQATLTIGGSTTVFPYDQQVVTWFQANNSNVQVSNQQGGSGAGIIAVCNGQVDIGASSRAMTSTELAACPTAVQTRLALSAVVPVVSATTSTTFTATSGWAQAVLASIYQVNGGGAGLITTPIANAGPGSSAAVFGLAAGAPSAACTGGVPGLAGKCYAWTDIPNNWGAVGCQSATVGATTCTYGVGGEIHLYTRGDNGGTSETFVTKLLGAKCGSDNQLQSCGVNVGASGGAAPVGNPALLAAIAADPLALGFNDYGFVASLSTVHFMPFQNASQSLPVGASVTTIKGGAASNPNFATTYGGWRPLEYITLGQPTGEVKQFITFAMSPSTNQLICTTEGFVSIYS